MNKKVIVIPAMELDERGSVEGEAFAGCDYDGLHDEVAAFMKISARCETHGQAMKELMTHLDGEMTKEKVGALALVIGHGCKAIAMESHIRHLKDNGELPDHIVEAMDNGEAQVVGMAVTPNGDNWGGNSGNGSGSVH